MEFRLHSDYQPMGDQPSAIAALDASLTAGNARQTLLGVTGSGKTFTMANLIARQQRPALIISHNKTLAAQLYSEFKHFFPENAVEYFVSYYDYYQPEAYVPQTDTFIEKDSAINEDIERMRISASSALLSRRDVIVIASVSCIYGLGSPEDFLALMIPLRQGLVIKRDELLTRLVANQYSRNDAILERCTFRARGETIDIWPAYMESAIRLEFWGDTLEQIRELDAVTVRPGKTLDKFDLYPANQYVTSAARVKTAAEAIRAELEERVAFFEKSHRLIEAQRIRMRVEHDLEMLRETGFCSGIENYSMHMAGRRPGERPHCLLDFFPEDRLVFIDESHVSVSQIGGMYHGDRARKEKLVDFGFRLPSAMENRPLRPEEFDTISGQTVYVSATPAPHEYKVSSVIAEQVIRPTGLLDPIMEVRPIRGQVEDIIGEAKRVAGLGWRTLVTTLTKRMSEDLSQFMREHGLKVEYLHSDIDAIERVEILRRLRAGKFDVLVGVNLLREGLDLPEVALVGILDADKEGFLRSETSLIQTSGRAARHVDGKVLLYADVMTKSLTRALTICGDRRKRQQAYNVKHGITPKSTVRAIEESLVDEEEALLAVAEGTDDRDVARVLADLETEMLEAADELQFEKAAMLRDQIEALRTGKPAPAKQRRKGGRR
ncbi:MAG: excinuclease ABC subunit B [Opitutia bacterium Tous-C2FEB]|jgi:excinuclease ABC subunit B|nr:MAG: excinuclease ABC subunit B [Opitutae bacterium Tous-C2FEB]